MTPESKQPVELRPHHLERSLQHVTWKEMGERMDAQGDLSADQLRNLEEERTMYGTLTRALDSDPDATVVFVRGFDSLCRRFCDTSACKQYQAIMETDRVVAEELGLEFDRPYRVVDVLNALQYEKDENPRTYFAIARGHERLSEWRSSVRKLSLRAIGITPNDTIIEQSLLGSGGDIAESLMLDRTLTKKFLEPGFPSVPPPPNPEASVVPLYYPDTGMLAGRLVVTTMDDGRIEYSMLGRFSSEEDAANEAGGDLPDTLKKIEFIRRIAGRREDGPLKQAVTLSESDVKEMQQLGLKATPHDPRKPRKSKAGYDTVALTLPDGSRCNLLVSKKDDNEAMDFLLETA